MLKFRFKMWSKYLQIVIRMNNMIEFGIKFCFQNVQNQVSQGRFKTDAFS